MGTFLSDEEIPSESESYNSDHLPSESDANSDSDFETSIDIRPSLQSWAVCHNITSDLLKLLQQHQCFSDLPVDSRSLLQTPRKTILFSVKPGQYCSFDWIKSIQEIILNSSEVIENNTILLQINIDGIPLYKGSAHQFWPILGSVEAKVFVIGIYSGEGKPESVNSYLSDFIETHLQISTV